jgi:hypothetical protein
MSRIRWRVARIAISLIVCVLSFALDHLAFTPYIFQAATIILVAPGIFISMAVSGNIHAFHIWIVAAGNLLFYLLTTSAVAGIWGRVRTSRQSPKAARIPN